MKRYSILPWLLLYSLYGNAQINNDTIQKVLAKTESEINFYSKNPKGLDKITVISISRHLDILKSVYAYQYEKKAYHKSVRRLDSLFQMIKINANTIETDTTMAKEIVSKIELYLKKREGEIIGLKLDNQNLRKQNYYLRMDTIRWAERFKMAKENELRYKMEMKKMQKRIKQYETGTYLGLSLGFNCFINNPPEYYVKPDSSIGILGTPRGISFLISGIVGYKFNDKHSIIFNVPLGDFTKNQENAIGIFNQKLAGGLGYGYHLAAVSIITILNISPYQKIAPEIMAGVKSENETFTSIDSKDFPTTTAYSPSITVGLSYNFYNKTGLLNNLPD